MEVTADFLGDQFRCNTVTVGVPMSSPFRGVRKTVEKQIISLRGLRHRLAETDCCDPITIRERLNSPLEIEEVGYAKLFSKFLANGLSRVNLDSV